MIVYIVRNNGTMDRGSYSDSVKVFTDFEKANTLFQSFISEGASIFGRIRATQEPGIKTFYKCGDIDVEIMGLYVEE